MEISQLQNALLVYGDWLTNQLILFENLFKPRQLLLAVYVLLTSSVLSTTSKRCFEQPAARFLVCSLIFIEYQLLANFLETVYDRKGPFCHKS